MLMHPPDAEANAVLNWRWRGGARAAVYPGFSLTVPDEYMTAGSVTEVVAPSYQRVLLPCDAASFAAAVDRVIETLVDTTWPVPGAYDWGPCLSVVFFDTATKGTGNIVDAIELADTGYNILAGGGAPRVAAGVFRFSSNPLQTP